MLLWCESPVDIDLESKGGMGMQDLNALWNLIQSESKTQSEFVFASAALAIAEQTSRLADATEGILEEMKNFNKPTGANIPLARVWDNKEDDAFNTLD